MAQFVLDSSIALSWCFTDEATPATDAIFDSLNTEQPIVPSLWFLEIANVLSLAERKKRIDDVRISKFIEMIGKMSLLVDKEIATYAFGDTFLLSRHYKLTAYDAAYLELAQRLDLPLATKDEQLIEAAEKLKIPLIKG